MIAFRVIFSRITTADENRNSTLSQLLLRFDMLDAWYVYLKWDGWLSLSRFGGEIYARKKHLIVISRLAFLRPKL